METAHESQRHFLKVNGCFGRWPIATIQHQTATEKWSTAGKILSIQGPSLFTFLLLVKCACTQLT